MSSYFDKPKYGDVFIFNLGVKYRGGNISRYFACCSGGHVYTGKDPDELALNIAKGMLSNPCGSSDTRLRFRPGEIYVKTAQGKKTVRHTAPVDITEIPDISDFSDLVRGKMNILRDDRLRQNKSPASTFSVKPGTYDEIEHEIEPETVEGEPIPPKVRKLFWWL